MWFTQGRAQGVPAHNETTVFFPGKQHEVVALEKSSGRVRWTARSPESTAYTQGLAVVASSKAVVFADRLLYAYDPTTGSPKWTFGSDGMLPAQSIPTAFGDLIISGSLEGVVYAIDAETGALRWSRSIVPEDVAAAVAFDPVVSDSLVLVGVAERGPRYHGGVAALRVSTGEVVWYTKFVPRDGLNSSACLGLVSVADGIAVATASDGQVHALEVSTGRWRWSSPADPGVGEGGDVRYSRIVGSVAVVGSLSGFITGIDLITGATLWRVNAARGSAGHPLASDGRFVYIIHSGGQLTAIEGLTGRIAWRYEFPGMSGILFYAASVDSGAVYAGGHTGFLALAK